MKLKSNRPVAGDHGTSKKFAWLPVQLGQFNYRGEVTSPEGRIWLEYYYEDWQILSGTMWNYKNVYKKYQRS